MMVLGGVSMPEGRNLNMLECKQCARYHWQCYNCVFVGDKSYNKDFPDSIALLSFVPFALLFQPSARSKALGRNREEYPSQVSKCASK